MRRPARTLRGKRVLVTGACGLVRRHLSARRVREGACVTAFVRHPSRADIDLLCFPPAETWDAIELIAADLRDSDAAHGACRRREAVPRLGAVIWIPCTWIHPREVVEMNAFGVPVNRCVDIPGLCGT